MHVLVSRSLHVSASSVGCSLLLVRYSIRGTTAGPTSYPFDQPQTRSDFHLFDLPDLYQSVVTKSDQNRPVSAQLGFCPISYQKGYQINAVISKKTYYSIGICHKLLLIWPNKRGFIVFLSSFNYTLVSCVRQNFGRQFQGTPFHTRLKDRGS